MKNIIPITELRNTVKIDELVNKVNDPIFVTKNGYSDLVIMSHEYYLNNFFQKTNKTKGKNTFIDKDEAPTMGFVRSKSVTIEIALGDVDKNLESIKKEIEIASLENVHLIQFQELTLTGSTLDDCIYINPLFKKIEKAISKIKQISKKHKMLIIFGAPLKIEGQIYNCALSIFNGEILSITPKRNVAAPFTKLDENKVVAFEKDEVIFSRKNILINNYFTSLKIGVTFGDDLLSVHSNVGELCQMGCTLICCLSANEELLENKDYYYNATKNISKINQVAIITSNSGFGESTSDSVCSGEKFIFELGDEVISNKPFDGVNSLLCDIDIDKISQYRLKNHFECNIQDSYSAIGFDLLVNDPVKFIRNYDKNPFIKDYSNVSIDLVKYILNIQANGLIKRLKTIHQHKVILGLSGGLDSTLALLVAYEAFKILNYDFKDIICITMPAFGTTSQTKNNATILAEKLGVTFRTIDISESVLLHLKDIGHDLSCKDIAYENAQARERTQILMDIANKENALQLGTGDLSELCLGWCTYNGDQMSMYSINSSIPKTMVKYLCVGYAMMNEEIKNVLLDIVDTPISPELIPGKEDKIAQKTEDIIGPYFLHDFIIYHFLNYSYSPKKMYNILIEVFKDDLTKEEILKWLKVFYKRFFQNQFKRTASPDGIKISRVSVSKKDLSLPSDISSQLFLDELNSI